MIAGRGEMTVQHSSWIKEIDRTRSVPHFSSGKAFTRLERPSDKRSHAVYSPGYEIHLNRFFARNWMVNARNSGQSGIVNQMLIEFVRR
jgi:hypothetical protein